VVTDPNRFIEIRRICDGGTNTIVSYEYDAADRRTQRTLENNTFTVYDYDDANQLTAISHQRSAGGVTNLISRYEYAYDAAGNRTNMVRSGMGFQPVRSESYSYDSADQLTGVTYATGGVTERTVSYQYDAAGNRTNLTEILGGATNTTSYAANSDNQLTSVTATRQGLTVTGYVEPGPRSNKWYASTATVRGQSAAVSGQNGTFAIPGVPVTGGANALTVTVTDVSGNVATQVVNVTVVNGTTDIGYDANGNQTTHNGWAMTYDRENRLASASSASLAVHYRYDALCRLVERVAGHSTNRLYYAGWQLIAEYDGTGALQKKYVYGPGIDEPIRLTSLRSPITDHYFHCDGLGSVTEITGADGALVESYRYDVFGTPTFCNANGVATNASAIGNRLLFTGRDRDPDNGWYNYRYRYYNPALGRFVQSDPIGIWSGDFNSYRYALSNPLRWKDSFGLEAIIILNNGTFLSAPTANDFLSKLESVADHSVKGIDIYGHAYGNQTFGTTEGESRDEITANLTSQHPGIYLLDESGQIGAEITQLLKNKLSKNARLGLRGCYTKRLASDISRLLSDTPVVGSTGPTYYHSQDVLMPTALAGNWMYWVKSNWQTYQNGLPQP
jgi:RHS repeat-associated protein